MEFALPVRTPLEQPRFLPMTREEMEALGWNELDVLLVSGDAYVDHPSFGIPLLGRYLVAHGYRTGIIAQPAWNGQQAVDALRVMGRPRLLAGLGAGALDSMLAHYTAFLKRRHDDAYTPGGKTGARPNRAVIVYANLLRQAFPGLPLAAGGIEASLRRAVHYDFWSDSLRRPLLFDAPLDAIIYGMGEHALLEIVRRLDALLDIVGDGGYTPDVAAGFGVWEGIRGTARLEKRAERREGAVYLPSYDEIMADPAALLKASVVMERECHNARHVLVQDCGGREVVMEPPSALLTTEEMDALYALPFTRQSHPSYKDPIPAEGMIATSITSHRGCGGGCSFCTLALHQGRCIAFRSEASILDEARRLAGMKGFSGSISDIGGPSANMWQARCGADPSSCRRTSCMFPRICPNFIEAQSRCVAMLRRAGAVPGVKHVRVASGVRFDLALQNKEALDAYAGEFTGGQLKIAPEHCVPEVLRRMRKPGLAAFEAFLKAFAEYSSAHGKEQYVVPYLMSAFPGCTDEDMRVLSRWLKARHWSPRQVQCFIPIPGTVATAMFYAGTDMEGRSIYIARSDAERRRQHNILLGEAAAERSAVPGKKPFRHGHVNREGRSVGKGGKGSPRNS